MGTDHDLFHFNYYINWLSMMNATAIIDAMMKKDLFSQWLGIERVEERVGYCKLKMTVRPEMCNGFEIAHGGITYSLADSALAFASNSNGRPSSWCSAC